MLSDAANKAYFGGAIVTVFNLALQIVLILTLEPGTYWTSNSFAAWLGFIVMFVVIAVLLIVQLFLWLSMLWFLFAHDLPLRLGSVGWLLLMLCTLPIGAAVYYTARYRKVARRLNTLNGFAPSPNR